jgi:glycerol-3-phosphate dehydrogenase
MRRDLRTLCNTEYDVLIVGGGAFGAAAAREATLRGLKVALIERGDFGAGSSAECFKMVHGGIRYLQHADIRRVRSSCQERSTFLRIAPHLVNPLPIAIPTYGRGRKGRALLGAGAAVYDALTFDRNAGIRDRTRRIQSTRFLPRAELLTIYPHLDSPELTGAVIFEDGQMYNPARLVLAFVKAAVTRGADVANYVEATGFVWEGPHVRGVRARDRLSGDEFDVRAQLTLNAAGPWADYLLNDAARFGPFRRPPFSRDAYFIVERRPTSAYALAVQGLSRDKDALIGRSNRHLFAAPWRDRMLFGVWHRHFPNFPDEARIAPEEIESWIAELNTVYPALQLSMDEVSFANCGLVPFGDTATEHELSFGKESRLIDHRATHAIGGLVSLVGIRFTTARADSQRALDLLLKQRPASMRTDDSRHASLREPLPGGDIEDFERFSTEATAATVARIPSLAGAPEALDGLLRNFGTQYREILACQQTHQKSVEDGLFIEATDTLTAEVAYAIEHEMAVHLDDVVFRRTNLAAGRHPGAAAVRRAGEVMAQRLQWSSTRLESEIAATLENLSRHFAREPRPTDARDRVTSHDTYPALHALA